ncbi:radical SAM protein [Streptomyces sp. LZ34]
MHAALSHKIQLLVDGLNISDEFYEHAQGYKGRIEAIYGHHKGAAPKRKIPQEIILHRPPGLRPTEAVVAQVRYNENSPHCLIWTPDGPALSTGGETVPIELIPEPDYYKDTLESGVKVSSVTQLLGTDLLGLVPSNYCALFSTKEECTFCEIIPHYALAREYRRSIKPDDVQISAMNHALATDPVDYIVFTTGNYDLENSQTVQHYYDVRSQLRVPPSVKRSYACFMPPDDVAALKLIKESGFTSVLLDIEVWDPEHYAGMVPGKTRWLGRDGFLRMLEAALEIFGQGEVYSNLVYGIQSLGGVPDGRRFHAEQETDLCLEATEGLTDRGVVPLFTIYHTNGHSKIGNIDISSQELMRFATGYGARTLTSGLVSKERNSVIFGLGSIANHIYNDSYYLAKTRM